jgi:NAD(P)-dependent dehydrogenase (short-subunit alcohol dehydrogenase family)
VIASSRRPRVDQALAMLPAGAEGHVLDLADAEAIGAFFERLGGFDHLVYTAGEPLQLGSLATTDVVAARRFFDVRYWGAYVATKYGCDRIRAGGSIVFTSGIAGHRPRAGWTLAASICSAMEGLTRALAVELAPIRVNIVSPGVVKTPLQERVLQADREAALRQIAGRLPVGHVADAAELAEAYLYLMRDSYITGQVLIVDGGGVLV